MASASSSSNAKNSRFSSFNVFKLSNKKNKSDAALPPPPPPKDPYYLHNRSLLSLSPDSLSLPNTPLSGPFQYQFPRKPSSQFLHPSSSSMSLVSSAASAVSYSPEVRPTLNNKKSGFFKFGRRSPRSPSVKSGVGTDETSTQSVEASDDGISQPWNFQHNVHVDDGLAGLPPSWMTQLADAGLSEDEIAAIQQARRNGARSPASQYLFNDRPHSPSMSISTSSSSVLTRPTPRSTSLPRQYTDSSSQNSHPVPPVPAINTSPSISSLSLHTTPTMPRTRNDSGSGTSLSVSISSDHARPMDHASPSGADAGTPVTPPTRRFHVVNTSPGIGSPPPSYANSVHNGYPADRKDRSLFNSPATAKPPSPPQRAPSNASTTSYASSKRRSKRFTALPPRLSLHEHDSDLSLWSEALISAIPSELSNSPTSASGSGSGSASPSSSTKATAGISGASSYSFLSRSSPSTGDSTRANGKMSGQPMASPIPPVIVNDAYGDEDTLSSTSSPLGGTFWNQQLGPRSSEYIAPALSESQSPTLPPNSAKESGNARLSSRWIDDDEDTDRHSYLSASSGDGRRDSSQSSTSTMSNVTVTATTIVRDVNIARRMTANVLNHRGTPLPGMGEEEGNGLLPSPTAADFMGRSGSRPDSLRHPASPLSSNFGSEEGSGSTSSSLSQETPTDPDREASSLMYYPEESSPDPMRTKFDSDSRKDGMYSPVDMEELGEEEDEFDEEESDQEEAEVLSGGSRTSMAISRPTIFINSTNPPTPVSPSLLTAKATAGTPATPALRYRGWLSEVVRPLEEFIDEPIDPRKFYLDLQEIAEGESGSVYAATLTRENLHKLRLAPAVKAQDKENAAASVRSLVAIKCVSILPTGSDKLVDLERELKLLKGLGHPHMLGMDAMYVDLQEDSLWIRMELMERSLADVIGLVSEGLMLQERMMARFASDVMEALQYLQANGIAHRDVRSDNLLLNSQGILKLTDFSNAVKVTPQSSMCTDQVGVLYWQAPEIRAGPYDALKVDVWSLGATVWEMAESEPPFSDAVSIEDRWPPLSQPELYSPAFRDFLRACSEPAAKRPSPADLIKNPFINNACGRVVIMQVLSQCTAIEKMLQEREEYPAS